MESYEQTVVSSTYQIAYSYSTYGNATVLDEKNRKHGVYTRPERVPLLNYSVSISPKLVAYFEQLFDVPYDYMKLGTFRSRSLNYFKRT